jgi:hypothetical protein
MRDIVVITCYQFEITDKLIELLGRDNCYLVVDSRPEDFSKFKDKYPDIILTSGTYGYYTLDEARGRVEMMYQLSKILVDRSVDWVHIISQNDLPTAGWYNRDNILTKGKEYININPDGWMSNYMTISPKLVSYLASYYTAILNTLASWIKKPQLIPKVGAPSEWILSYPIKGLDKIDRVNDDLRIHPYYESVSGFDSRKLGHPTKKSSPFTLDNTEELHQLLSEPNWYLFARKFEYNSDAYKWTYNRALNEYKG